MKPIFVAVDFDSLEELREIVDGIVAGDDGGVEGTLEFVVSGGKTHGIFRAPRPSVAVPHEPDPAPPVAETPPAPAVSLPGDPPWIDAAANPAEVDLPNEPEPPAEDPVKVTEADCREALKAYFSAHGAEACKAVLQEFGAAKVSDLAEFEYAPFLRRLEVGPKNA